MALASFLALGHGSRVALGTVASRGLRAALLDGQAGETVAGLLNLGSEARAAILALDVQRGLQQGVLDSLLDQWPSCLPAPVVREISEPEEPRREA